MATGDHDESRRKAKRAKYREYWAANGDRLRQRRRARYQADPEPERGRMLRIAAEHPGYFGEVGRRYRANNPAKASEIQRRYRESHPEKRLEISRNYRAAKPEMHRAKKARRRALKLSLPCDWSTANMRAALAYWDNACAACRTPFGLIAREHWDHWVPLSSPTCPGTVPTNMVPLCSVCNLGKQTRSPADWVNRAFPPNCATVILRNVALYFSSLCPADRERAQHIA